MKMSFVFRLWRNLFGSGRPGAEVVRSSSSSQLRSWPRVGRQRWQRDHPVPTEGSVPSPVAGAVLVLRRREGGVGDTVRPQRPQTGPDLPPPDPRRGTVAESTQLAGKGSDLRRKLRLEERKLCHPPVAENVAKGEGSVQLGRPHARQYDDRTDCAAHSSAQLKSSLLLIISLMTGN